MNPAYPTHIVQSVLLFQITYSNDLVTGFCLSMSFIDFKVSTVLLSLYLCAKIGIMI